MTGYGEAREYAVANSGNYKSDPKTGLFRPETTQPKQVAQDVPDTKSLIQAMMTAYLRKGQGYRGGYTSAAPAGILQSMKGFDPYQSYGVPYSGIGYSGIEKTGGFGNPYAAIFSPTPSNDDSTGY